LFGYQRNSALRSLSALLGVGHGLSGVASWGQRLFNSYGLRHMPPFVAAISPLLVYYSQESTHVYAALFFGVSDCVAGGYGCWLSRLRGWLVVAICADRSPPGLYTHYAYPVMLANR
jgi:hypothetical protein